MGRKSLGWTGRIVSLSPLLGRLIDAASPNELETNYIITFLQPLCVTSGSPEASGSRAGQRRTPRRARLSCKCILIFRPMLMGAN